MIFMKCFVCGKKAIKIKDTLPDGQEYEYTKCPSCGEELVDMTQLHKLAEKYRKMKRYHAKISKWGSSLGVRIPKELAKKYNLKENKEITFIPEKDFIKIVN